MDFPVRFFFLLLRFVLQHPQTVYLLIWLTDDLLDEQVGEGKRERGKEEVKKNIQVSVLLKNVEIYGI